VTIAEAIDATAAGDVAAALDLIADQVEHDPRHVLDVIRDVAVDFPPNERDRLVGRIYVELTDYLSVETLDHWGASRSSSEVAAKLRAAARTIRRGGPAHVDAVPPITDPADAVVVERAEAAGRKDRVVTPIGRLRMERGQLASRLVRMRRAQHPNPSAITDAELRLVEVERELAELEAREAHAQQRACPICDDVHASAADGPHGYDCDPADGDARALALIDQSQAFPRDRRPVVSRSGL